MKDGESGSNEGHENSSCAAENFFPIAVIISVGGDADGDGAMVIDCDGAMVIDGDDDGGSGRGGNSNKRG